MKRVLVTGACGFLGRHVAACFRKNGFNVSGLGHGHWGSASPKNHGIDQWILADVTMSSLKKLRKKFDCIIHCAGGSSVGYSVNFPMEEFQKTVNSAINVLEYTRIYQPEAKVIFPSSAAVYGEKRDEPLKESENLAPVSPYGFYKKITEELCESYARNFNISVSVIRFFSIYGTGLKKQLLWDACTRLSSGSKEAVFFGTGKETRDWLHIEDAVNLIYLMSQVNEGFRVVNGGSGERETVLKILLRLKKILDTEVEVVMNGNCKEGDPLHYWADIAKLRYLGWKPQKDLEIGLLEYVDWFQENSNVPDYQ